MDTGPYKSGNYYTYVGRYSYYGQSRRHRRDEDDIWFPNYDDGDDYNRWYHGEYPHRYYNSPNSGNHSKPKNNSLQYYHRSDNTELPIQSRSYKSSSSYKETISSDIDMPIMKDPRIKNTKLEIVPVSELNTLPTHNINPQMESTSLDCSKNRKILIDYIPDAAEKELSQLCEVEAFTSIKTNHSYLQDKPLSEVITQQLKMENDEISFNFEQSETNKNENDIQYLINIKNSLENDLAMLHDDHVQTESHITAEKRTGIEEISQAIAESSTLENQLVNQNNNITNLQETSVQNSFELLNILSDSADNSSQKEKSKPPAKITDRRKTIALSELKDTKFKTDNVNIKRKRSNSTEQTFNNMPGFETPEKIGKHNSQLANLKRTDLKQGSKSIQPESSAKNNGSSSRECGTTSKPGLEKCYKRQTRKVYPAASSTCAEEKYNEKLEKKNFQQSSSQDISLKQPWQKLFQSNIDLQKLKATSVNSNTTVLNCSSNTLTNDNSGCSKSTENVTLPDGFSNYANKGLPRGDGDESGVHRSIKDITNSRKRLPWDASLRGTSLYKPMVLDNEVSGVEQPLKAKLKALDDIDMSPDPNSTKYNGDKRKAKKVGEIQCSSKASTNSKKDKPNKPTLNVKEKTPCKGNTVKIAKPGPALKRFKPNLDKIKAKRKKVANVVFAMESELKWEFTKLISQHQVLKAKKCHTPRNISPKYVHSSKPITSESTPAYQTIANVSIPNDIKCELDIVTISSDESDDEFNSKTSIKHVIKKKNGCTQTEKISMTTSMQTEDSVKSKSIGSQVIFSDSPGALTIENDSSTQLDILNLLDETEVKIVEIDDITHHVGILCNIAITTLRTLKGCTRQLFNRFNCQGIPAKISTALLSEVDHSEWPIIRKTAFDMWQYFRTRTIPNFNCNLLIYKLYNEINSKWQLNIDFKYLILFLNNLVKELSSYKMNTILQSFSEGIMILWNTILEREISSKLQVSGVTHSLESTKLKTEAKPTVAATDSAGLQRCPNGKTQNNTISAQSPTIGSTVPSHLQTFESSNTSCAMPVVDSTNSFDVHQCPTPPLNHSNGVAVSVITSADPYLQSQHAPKGIDNNGGNGQIFTNEQRHSLLTSHQRAMLTMQIMSYNQLSYRYNQIVRGNFEGGAIWKRSSLNDNHLPNISSKPHISANQNYPISQNRCSTAVQFPKPQVLHQPLSPAHNQETRINKPLVSTYLPTNNVFQECRNIPQTLPLHKNNVPDIDPYNSVNFNKPKRKEQLEDQRLSIQNRSTPPNNSPINRNPTLEPPLTSPTVTTTHHDNTPASNILERVAQHTKHGTESAIQTVPTVVSTSSSNVKKECVENDHVSDNGQVGTKNLHTEKTTIKTEKKSDGIDIIDLDLWIESKLQEEPIDVELYYKENFLSFKQEVMVKTEDAEHEINLRPIPYLDIGDNILCHCNNSPCWECLCGAAFYCSTDCAKNDWPNHSVSCQYRQNQELNKELPN